MTDATYGDRDLARRLVLIEAGEDCTRPSDRMAAGERVLQQLTGDLTRWFGPEGVDALVMRALDRARAESPALIAVEHAGPGRLRLGELTDAMPSRDPAALTEGFVALIATLIALLERLVGADMARRLVELRWPEQSVEAAAPSNGPTLAPQNEMNTQRINE